MNITPLLGLNGSIATGLPLVSIPTIGIGLNMNLAALSSSALLAPLNPIYEQTGPIYNGPGSLYSRETFALPGLELEQREAVERARKYAIEESFKSALAKQARQLQLQSQPAPSKKEQTINLLSRVYVGSISYDLKEESLKAAFQLFGAIRTVTLSWDAATQKHKGFAFIEFEYPEAARLAIEQMNNASLGGRQLKVGRPSNLPHADPLIAELVTEYQLGKKVYVSDVHPGLSEKELALVFESFGEIVSCRLVADPTGEKPHRGFGFIEYTTEQSANDAVTNMNMFDLGGHFLRVTKAISPPDESTPTTSGIPTSTALAINSVTAKILAMEAAENAAKVRSPTSSGTDERLDGFNPIGQAPPALSSWDAFESQELGVAKKSSFMDDEDDDEGTLEHQENFHISGREARSVIMQKLIRPPIRGVMILRNMVGPDDCDDELEEEVKEECSNYGSVERVVIYQELDEDNQLIIKIFVVFQESESLERAIAALNGRFFAGRQVIAERYELEKFDSNDLTG